MNNNITVTIANEVADIINAKSLVGRATVETVAKNNGIVKIGIKFSANDCIVSPILYIDDFAEIPSAEKIAELMIDKFKDSLFDKSDKLINNAGELNDKQSVLGNVKAKLIGSDKNSEYIKGLVHRKIANLYVVYYCTVDNSDSNLATFNIKNEFATMLNITEKELFEASIRNADNFKIQSLFSKMMELQGMEFNDDECNGISIGIITNKSGMFGASAIININMLDKACEFLNTEEIFILPSSIHEILFLKTDGSDVQTLFEIVSSINATEVDAAEVLSDSVYRYSKITKVFDIA